MSQAGKQVVADRLVDSFFGNVSYCLNHILYISQTGAALDELDGCIDPVPLDGSTSAGITASSELSAHLEIIARTGCRAILHGHPRFSVILSMDCDPDQNQPVPLIPGATPAARSPGISETSPSFPGKWAPDLSGCATPCLRPVKCLKP